MAGKEGGLSALLGKRNKGASDDDSEEENTEGLAAMLGKRKVKVGAGDGMANDDGNEASSDGGGVDDITAEDLGEL